MILILRDKGSDRLYSLQDALFNVVALTDDTGSVKERFAYQPYGKSETLTPAFADRTSSLYNWETRFTGRELDLDTGLQLNRNRYYHNQLGRWINRDPIGYDDAMNLYGYVRGFPTIAVDPSGLWKKISKSIYEAEKDGEDLAELAKIVNGRENEWVCIWPIVTTQQLRQLWQNYPKAKKCARANVSNLIKKKGLKMTMIQDFVNTEDNPDNFMQAVSFVLRPTKWTNGKNAAERIKTKSKQGKTPISLLVLGGHCFGDASIGSNGTSFNTSHIFDVATEKDNSKNTFNSASRSIGPPKCWFCNGAKVYGFACDTGGPWADSWANDILRTTSHAYGTPDLVYGEYRGKKGLVVLGPGADSGIRHTTLTSLLSDPNWVEKKGTQ